MSVIVATVNIAIKLKITLEMMGEIKVPPKYIKAGAVRSLDKNIGVINA